MRINWNKVLPIVSSVGVAVTSGLSFWGGSKYNEKKEEKGKKALLYILPGAATAVVTIVSIAVNGHITGKEFAVLAGSGAYLFHERDKFKDTVKERLIGSGYTPTEADKAIQEDTEEAHRRAVAEIMHNGEKFVIPTVEETGHGKTLCIDCWSGRAFRASMAWVEEGIRNLNVLYKTPTIINEGTQYEQAIAPGVGMCDLFGFWGIRVTTMSCEYGWPGDQETLEEYGALNIPDLGIHAILIQNPKDYNEPVIFIEYTYGNYPIECYYEY